MRPILTQSDDPLTTVSQIFPIIQLSQLDGKIQRSDNNIVPIITENSINYSPLLEDFTQNAESTFT